MKFEDLKGKTLVEINGKVGDDEMIEVKITEAEVSIIERDKSWEDSDSTILIRVSSKTLLQMIFGLANPYIALLAGRVKIRGMKNILRVMKMLQTIRVRQPWTEGMVDRG